MFGLAARTRALCFVFYFLVGSLFTNARAQTAPAPFSITLRSGAANSSTAAVVPVGRVIASSYTQASTAALVFDAGAKVSTVVPNKVLFRLDLANVGTASLRALSPKTTQALKALAGTPQTGAVDCLNGCTLDKQKWASFTFELTIFPDGIKSERLISETITLNVNGKELPLNLKLRVTGVPHVRLASVFSAADLDFRGPAQATPPVLDLGYLISGTAPRVSFVVTSMASAVTVSSFSPTGLTTSKGKAAEVPASSVATPFLLNLRIPKVLPGPQSVIVSATARNASAQVSALRFIVRYTGSAVFEPEPPSTPTPVPMKNISHLFDWKPNVSPQNFLYSELSSKISVDGAPPVDRISGTAPELWPNANLNIQVKNPGAAQRHRDVAAKLTPSCPISIPSTQRFIKVKTAYVKMHPVAICNSGGFWKGTPVNSPLYNALFTEQVLPPVSCNFTGVAARLPGAPSMKVEYRFYIAQWEYDAYVGSRIQTFKGQCEPSGYLAPIDTASLEIPLRDGESTINFEINGQSLNAEGESLFYVSDWPASGTKTMAINFSSPFLGPKVTAIAVDPKFSAARLRLPVMPLQIALGKTTGFSVELAAAPPDKRRVDINLRYSNGSFRTLSLRDISSSAAHPFDIEF